LQIYALGVANNNTVGAGEAAGASFIKNLQEVLG
jgi:hypothetical protein